MAVVYTFKLQPFVYVKLLRSMYFLSSSVIYILQYGTLTWRTRSRTSLDSFIKLNDGALRHVSKFKANQRISTTKFNTLHKFRKFVIITVRK